MKVGMDSKQAHIHALNVDQTAGVMAIHHAQHAQHARHVRRRMGNARCVRMGLDLIQGKEHAQNVQNHHSVLEQDHAPHVQQEEGIAVHVEMMGFVNNAMQGTDSHNRMEAAQHVDPTHTVKME